MSDPRKQRRAAAPLARSPAGLSTAPAAVRLPEPGRSHPRTPSLRFSRDALGPAPGPTCGPREVVSQRPIRADSGQRHPAPRARCREPNPPRPRPGRSPRSTWSTIHRRDTDRTCSPRSPAADVALRDGRQPLPRFGSTCPAESGSTATSGARDSRLDPDVVARTLGLTLAESQVAAWFGRRHTRARHRPGDGAYGRRHLLAPEADLPETADLTAGGPGAVGAVDRRVRVTATRPASSLGGPVGGLGMYLLQLTTMSQTLPILLVTGRC